MFDSPVNRSLKWLKNQELASGGLRVHSGHHNAYPEVTGYAVLTLLDYGESEVASRLANWLLQMQRPDGSYADPDYGVAQVFDSGQVLRGLLAVAEQKPEALQAAKQIADYLCSQMLNNGLHGFAAAYSGTIPEPIQLYVLPPLFATSEALGEPRYCAAASACLQFYLGHAETLRVSQLTHFLAYQIEALISLGYPELAEPTLRTLQEGQFADGSVRAKEGVRWVCTPGLAQLAVCWYLLGQWRPADKAMAWLDAHQEPDGGFRGSYGKGATYFPDVELSWAAKYYLDAHRLRVLAAMERSATIFPDSVPTDDGRLHAIAAKVRPNDRVIEAGCGKGRFLSALKQICSPVDCHGVDISPVLLSFVPAGIVTKQGWLENIPYEANAFDVAFSVEAIEHALNQEAAVRELVRITKPGGWVIIIDKQHSHWGRLDCPSWERWPVAEHLNELLKRECDEVVCEAVSYDGLPADGLMMVWRGKKRN